MKKIKEKIVILYDGSDCSDGFGGAWVAWKKFGKKAKYIGVEHHQPVPRGLENKIIYMIDFTYSENITRCLIKKNISVTAIDHHGSTKNATTMTQNYSYSSENSGCVLAWKYFFAGKSVPKFLKYIEDTDLWKFQLPFSKEFFAYHDTFDFDFKVWDKLIKKLEDPREFKKFIETGKVVLRYIERQTDLLIKKNMEKVRFDGYVVPAINSPLFANELGGKLSKKFPFVIIWRKKAEEIYVSLRSDGRVDVSSVAGKYGGGGHRESSGFVIKNNKLPWKTIK